MRLEHRPRASVTSVGRGLEQQLGGETPAYPEREIPAGMQGMQMKRSYSLSRALVVCTAALLVACGGGGATDNPPGNPPSNPPATPPPSGPVLVVSSSQISVEALSSDPVVTRSFTVTVNSLVGAPTIYLGSSNTSYGIQQTRLTFSANISTVIVTFKDPSTMAAGTYIDTMTVHACYDEFCRTHVQGSPHVITVTYTVTRVAVSTAVTFTASQVAVSGSNQTTHASIDNESIGFTITRPTATMWARTTVEGAGTVVTNAAAVYVPSLSTIDGKLRLTLPPPSTLDAGTYTDNVKVEFCLDAQCLDQAIGSPANIAVTYTVTGSPHPNITVQWSQGPLSGAELVTSETRQPILTLTLVMSEQIRNGVYVLRSPSATGLITNVVETSRAGGSQSNATTGRYDVYLKSPSTLGSGTFTDTIQFEACFDAACTAPVPNSKYDLSVSVTIAATEGVEFTRRTVPISGAMDVAWSAASQLLYVSSSAGALHRLTQVNPLSLAVTQGPALGAEFLHHLAITSDGSYLYAGSKTRPYVHRLLLPAMTMDISVPLGEFSGSPYLVNDLATLPGQPQSFVAAVAWNGNHGGVYVYDNSTLRPVSVAVNPAQALEVGRWLVPTATAGVFISQSFGPSVPKVNNIDQLKVDANGITTIASTPSAYPLVIQKPQLAGARLFSVNGQVLDARNGALLATLSGGGGQALLVDETRGRLFVWTQLNQKDVILAYDLATLTLLGNVPVYAGSVMSGSPTKAMTRWGSNGLALVDGGQLILLSGPFFSN
jgi:hypothetical protein